MSVSDFLGRWVDLTAHLLSRPDLSDPMVDICAELSVQFDARMSGTVDFGEARARIGIYSIDGPDATRYVGRVGDHPLALYFRATNDSHARSLADAEPFLDDPWAEAMMVRLREDQMRDFVFLPLTPPEGMDHRWLALSSSEPLRSAARDDVDRIAGLIRALDAQGQVLAISAPRLDGRGSSAALGLSSREVAVLTLTARGLTAGAIASQLRISPRTVSKHQQNAYRKLNVGDRLSAVLRAQQLGLLPLTRRRVLGVPMVEAEVDGHDRASIAR